MDNQIKYCRYKGYLLQVQSETFDKINVVTSDWGTGTILKLICHDRDHFTEVLNKNDVECIFTVVLSDNFYDSINIEYGNIIAKNYENVKDNLFSEFAINGEFAKYKGEIFRSYSGYNHKYWFKLVTNNSVFQDIGFIMEKPGVFNKCVNPNEIDFAFESQTLCNYNGKEFYVVDADSEGKILLEPYDRDLYLESELLEMGLETINTKLGKWVNPKNTDKIWTKTKKIFDFEKYKCQDEILFEK